MRDGKEKTALFLRSRGDPKKEFVQAGKKKGEGSGTCCGGKRRDGALGNHLPCPTGGFTRKEKGEKGPDGRPRRSDCGGRKKKKAQDARKGGVLLICSCPPSRGKKEEKKKEPCP